MKSKLLPIFFLLLTICGCNSTEDEYVAPTKAVTPFEGKVDPKFVGTWETKDKKSTYVFEDSGDFQLSMKVSTPSGSIDSKSEGKWLVNGDRFLVKDSGGNIVPYSFVIDSNSLTLALTGSMKSEVSLIRVKK